MSPSFPGNLTSKRLFSSSNDFSANNLKSLQLFDDSAAITVLVTLSPDLIFNSSIILRRALLNSGYNPVSVISLMNPGLNVWLFIGPESDCFD